ncbi:MAG: hypothetical protein ACTHJG_00170 [Rhodanobacteraceae bacterium]
MSRRSLTKSERERVITIDLLADWRAHADPLPEPCGDHDWRYHGTITRDGVTAALAWRAGGLGHGIGGTVTECSLWDRIKIDRILCFENPPGLDGRPRFAPATMANTGQFSTATTKQKP